MSVLYVCAGGTESFENAFTCGIGLINASINLSKFLATQSTCHKSLYLSALADFMIKAKNFLA